MEDNSGPIDLTEEDDDVPEIDLTNEDVLEMLTVEEVEHLQAIRDRYPASPRTSPPPRSDTPVRCVEIQAARSTGNIHLEPGMTVEMHPDRDLHQTVYGDFIRIKKIFYNLDDHSITLRGQKFRRTHKLKGMLHTHMTNEVYMVLHESLDIGIQSDLEISLDQVLNVRTLIITNRPFPSLSWRDDIKWTGTGLDEIKWQGPLVCRWKFILSYDSSAEQRRGRVLRWSLLQLRNEEADKGCGMIDKIKRTEWRPKQDALEPKEVVDLTGSALEQHQVTPKAREREPRNLHDPVDLTKDNEDHFFVETIQKVRRTTPLGIYERTITNTTKESFRPMQPLTSGSAGKRPLRVETQPQLRAADPRKRTCRTTSRMQLDTESKTTLRDYSFFDAFCGAGGASAGARDAGLKVIGAFDRNPDAVATYRANFRRTRIFCQDATAFITSAAGRLVDVLHISPPCQPWSPAHTIDGKDDAANIASLFTVSELIQKLRPRIVTIEQTAGLLQRHPVFFHTLIRQLTDHGYGISWQIIQCLGYGNPSVRKRLLMIASCPGEPHPPFTKPTHGTSPGVIPFRTIHNAISSVRPGMPNHNPESYIRKNEAPYSAHKPVDQCITTNGGKASVHPSGKRDFTNRELAALQAFNHTHVFVGTRSSVRRQIGNALPPVVSKALYIEIVKCLRETDEREAREDDIVMIE